MVWGKRNYGIYHIFGIYSVLSKQCIAKGRNHFLVKVWQTQEETMGSAGFTAVTGLANEQKRRYSMNHTEPLQISFGLLGSRLPATV